jgi:hypothetical protein
MDHKGTKTQRRIENGELRKVIPGADYVCICGIFLNSPFSLSQFSIPIGVHLRSSAVSRIPHPCLSVSICGPTAFGVVAESRALLSTTSGII